MMDNDQIDRVRKIAHKLWEDEGKPEGKAAEHWQAAEALIGASSENADAEISRLGASNTGQSAANDPGSRPAKPGAKAQ